jgi:2-phosphoglycerate kinase
LNYSAGHAKNELKRRELIPYPHNHHWSIPQGSEKILPLIHTSEKKLKAKLLEFSVPSFYVSYRSDETERFRFVVDCHNPEQLRPGQRALQYLARTRENEINLLAKAFLP